MTNPQRTLGIGINDIPIWLFKEFKEECKQYHSDVHWVTLLSWYQKSRSFDALMSGQASVAVPAPQEEEEKPQKEEEDEPSVMTIGGKMKGR